MAQNSSIFVQNSFISKESPLFSHNRKKRPFLEVNNSALEGCGVY